MMDYSVMKQRQLLPFCTWHLRVEEQQASASLGALIVQSEAAHQG